MRLFVLGWLGLMATAAVGCKGGDGGSKTATPGTPASSATPASPMTPGGSPTTGSEPTPQPPGPTPGPDGGPGTTTATGSDGSPGPGSEQAAAISVVGTIAFSSAVDLNAVALPVNGGFIDYATLKTPPQAAITAGQLSLEIPGEAPGLGLAEEGAGEHATSAIAVFETPPSGKRMDAIETLQFIEMPVAGADSLVGLPTSGLKGDEIALGAVDADASGKLVAETVASESLFDATPGELLARARSDDAMKTVKNTFVNTDPTSGIFYQPSLVFLWKGFFTLAMANDDATAPKPVINQASATGEGDAPRFFGHGVAIDTNDPALGSAEICKDLATVPDVQLYPATPIQLIGEHEDVFNDDTKLDLANGFESKIADTYWAPGAGTCVYQKAANVDGNSAFNHSLLDLLSIQSGDGRSHVTFGGPRVIYGPVQTGIWELRRDGAAVARFDLAVNDAVVSQDVGGTTYRRPTVFIPAVQIVKAPGTDEIAAMRVRFYSYKLDEGNPAASTFEAVPFELMREFVTEVDGYLNSSGISRPQVFASARAKLADLAEGASYIEFADPLMRKFLFAPAGTTVPADKERIWSAVVGYKMFGNRYEVRLRCTGSMVGDVVCET